MRTRALASLILALAACERAPQTVAPAPGPAVAEACPGSEGFAALWSPTRRASLDAALEPIPGEWPAQLVASLDARMPALERDWSRAYARACAEPGAAPVLRCLDAQAWTLDAALTLLADDPDRAAGLWSALERSSVDPQGCAEARAEPPALAPAQGRALASLALLAELGELDELARLLAELEADPTLSETAHALPLTLAQARLEAAANDDDAAAQALARAQTLAEGIGPRARLVVADLRASLIEARGLAEPSAAEAARAQVLELAREQGEPWIVAAQLGALGRARLARGEPAAAANALVEAIAVAGRVGSPDDPRTAALQLELAEAQLELGRIEAAHDALTQARDAFVIALGPDHPQTLATVEAVGRLLVRAGQPGDAQFAFLDLLEIYTELYGVKHWRTAKVKLELADSLMAMDQHEGAQQLYTEALTPLAQALGAVHPDVVRASIHLGIAELALGKLDAAQLNCARGRDLAKALGPDSPLADEAQRCLAEIAAQAKPGRRGRK